MDKSIYAFACLEPEFVTKGSVAELSVAIVELVAPPVARLTADLTGFGDHLFNQRLINLLIVAWHHRDVRTIGAHCGLFLIAECVRENKMCFVPKSSTHERQRDSSCSGGVFDDGTAR